MNNSINGLNPQTVTQWLLRWHAGDESAINEITEQVYQDLRRSAQNLLCQERPGRTLQATALVHEAYLQLHQLQHIPWKNRAQFICTVAQVMRHVLVDHARERAAQKRGGEAVRVTLSHADEINPEAEIDLLALNEALERLAKESPRKARVVDLSYFAGLSAKEVAEVLSADQGTISQRTIENDLKIARAKLHNWLTSDEETNP